MEKKQMLTFGLLAVLAVAVIALLVANAGMYSEEEVNAQLDELQAQNAEALDELSLELERTLEEAKAEADAALEQLSAAKAAELAARDAEVARLEGELSAATEELATEAEADELYPSGEVLDNLFLGDVITFSLDDGDIEKLLDGEIEFNEEDYDVHEEFVAENGDVVILYSAVDDEEFSGNPYVGLEKGSFEYRFVFDDPIDMAEVSDDEPLDLRFLGVDMQVVAVSEDEISFRSGSEFILREGETMDFEGQTVVLGFVSENGRVTVCVDDECDVIDEYETETIAGLDVRAEDILVNSREGVATLVLGEDTLLELDNGEEWMGDDESPFDFHILSSGGMLEGLSLTYEESHDELDDEYPVLGVGDYLAFPNDFLTFKFNDVLEADYIQFDFEFEGFNEELADETDVDNDECMLVSTDNKDIEVLNDETDEVYVCQNGNAYYQDNNDDWYEVLVTDVKLVNDDSEYSLAIGGADRLRIQGNNDALIRLDTVWADERLGAEEDEAEAGDVLLAALMFGEREYDVLTPYGAVLVDVENNADNDEFSLMIPSDKLELEFVVY